MTITANPSVRQVLARIVADPRYPEVARKPLISWPHLAVLGAAYAVFAGSTWAYLADQIPFVAMLLLNQFAIYASFTPMHEAVHGSASSNSRLNDLIGTASIQLLLPGLTTPVYRILHMEHHRWVGDKRRDPDLIFVEAPKPLLPLVLMIPEWVWTKFYFTRLWRTRPRGEVLAFVGALAVYVGVHVAFLLSPWALEFVLVWLLPQKLGMLVLVYAFAHVQHPEDSNWDSAPFQSTAKITGTAIGKVYWLGQTDHCVHHALPHIPFHRYHRVWQLGDEVLREQGIPERGLFRGPKEIQWPRAPYETVRQVWVAEARDVGRGVRTFLLEGTDGPLPTFTAGAHIDVHLPSGRVRQYSLCNPPGETSYRIAVKADPHGRGGSTEVHQALTVGVELAVSDPRNNFALGSANRYVLVSGGIGITPLLAMAHELHAQGKDFVLHVCGPDAGSIPFAAEFETLPFGGRIEAHLDAERGVTSLQPDAALGPWTAGAQLYLCGPPGFMSWVQGRAIELGWPLDTVHRESFCAPVFDVTESRPFEVVLARSSLTLTVPADKQILDVLAQNEIVVPWACSQGVCGSCITPVLAGEPEHRDAVLPSAVRAANTAMCLCVSRAKSPRVVLDL